MAALIKSSWDTFNFGLFDNNRVGLNDQNIGTDVTNFSTTQTTNNPAIVTRFIRANEVVFTGTSLCPDKVPNYFFDESNVNLLCQKSNRIELYPSNNASIFTQSEGIVDTKTNAYARVLTTSNNIVYVDQNYITVNIAPYGANTLPFPSSAYVTDDVVYQTDSAGTTCFQGRVAYFDNANGVLAIMPSSGTINAAGSYANSTFRKINSTQYSNATSIIRGNTFQPNSIIRSATNAANVGNIYAYSHSSGAFTSANGTNTLTIIVQSNSSIQVGNTLTIVTGGAQGESRQVVAVTSNNELVLSSALLGLTSNSRYTMGPHVVDEYGKITGIFNIPETDSSKFPAGSRVFTITDAATSTAASFLMRATATYNVVGQPQPIPPPVVIPPTPVTPTRRRDPLAQTFFTPEVNTLVSGSAKQNYGIYVSSVDLFFAEKPILADLQLPVTVQIVTVENGIPTEKVLASKSIECKSVNISTVPDASNTSTLTNFRFDDPVYLESETQYALIVKSDSPDYAVFICELGGSILGTSPARRVSTQPYVGSFFKSQNASTWTPIQNQDLMFRINKCVFTPNSTGTVLLKPKNQLANVNVDSILVHSYELNHKPTTSKYKFLSTNISYAQDAQYTYVPVNSLYRFGGDLATSQKTSTRRRVIVGGNSASFVLGAELTTSDADVSPLVDTQRISVVAYENIINDASISNTNIAITSGTAHLNAANIIVTFSAPDLSDGVKANAYVSALSSGAISTIIVDNAGSGYITTPTITFAETGVASNATAIVAGETSSSGGNCLCRYVTKQITLADGFDAGDLRVYIDANRPAGTNIHVYYKVKSSSDPQNFTEKKWQLMTKTNDLYSADQNQLVEMEYRPSLTKNILSYTENGIVYPLGGKFKYFAIKIVMTAEDTTVVPSIKNYRAIAIPSG